LLILWGALAPGYADSTVPAIELPAYYEERPKWELAIGATAITIPDYRGSDEQSYYLLPFPAVAYRGEILKADRDGVRAEFLHTDRVKFDISLNAGPPAKSDENAARAGMPDIDPTIELGPMLKVLLAASDNRNHALSVRIPVRAVISVPDFDNRGWVFVPYLNYDIFNVFGQKWLEFGASVGVIYGSEKFHDYYFQVDPQYATPTRPAYDAKAGYSGTQFTVTLSKRFESFYIGGYARYENLSGTAFEDSPLVRQDHLFLAGVVVTWIFAKSSEMVRVPLDVLR
jgi:outer membrane scaffolding protein for murein synthesis (MipA/OmpV family)